jgi:hypothetical protein
MSYQPKPGDRVTSPLLVGEWEVICRQQGQYVVEHESKRIMVSASYLTPVVPPLPPEPVFGSVVYANGLYWQRQFGLGGWQAYHGERWHHALWPDLAADAVPVVPVTTAAEWMLSAGCMPHTVNCFRDEFGGFDD